MGFYIAVLCCLFSSALATFQLVLLNDDTKVVGKDVTNKVEAFLGIPYAEPPIKSLRFALPRAPQKKDRIDAYEYKKNCVQIQSRNRDKDASMSEDCLYLNIFRPKPKKNTKYPVLVYIQGKGFEQDREQFKPIDIANNIVTRDIIFVTLKYRLNIFGFPDGPGFRRNLGLLDQVAALNWLKDNLEAFGGDNEKVTLMGDAAGASAVNYHLHSYASLGLFQKAIMAGGTRVDRWSNQDLAGGDNYNATKRVGAEKGCSFQQDLPYCLQEGLSWQDLRNYTYKVTYNSDPPLECCIWSPLEDIYSAPPNEDSSAMHHRKDIRILMGNAKEELLRQVIDQYYNPGSKFYGKGKELFNHYIGVYSKGIARTNPQKDLHDFYKPAKNNPKAEDWIHAAAKMISGAVKHAPTIREARNLLKFAPNIYLYSIDYDDFFKWTPEAQATYNYFDMGSLFREPTANNKVFVETLSNVFTSFVKNERPIVPNEFIWPTMGEYRNFVSIARSCKLDANYAKDEDKIWNEQKYVPDTIRP